MSSLSLEPIRSKIQPSNYDLACKNWQVIVDVFNAHGISDDCNLAAVCATVAVETGYTFKPEEERGDPTYFLKNYYFNRRVRIALGNRSTADAVKYHGRGFIQITGFNNYNKASEALGINLVANPELACDVETAAKIMHWYWTSHKLDVLANQASIVRDEAHKVLVFQEIRRLVNGGLNGITVYLDVLKSYEVV